MPQAYLEYRGDSVELPIGETLIGRDVGCSLRFNDATVSRKHLRFICRHDEVFIEDLGSSNGTLLNGRRIGEPVRLYDGDKISAGNREMTFHLSDGDGAAESTVLLKNLNAAESSKGPRMAKAMRAATAITAVTAVTARMAVVIPPHTTNQRCPQCAAPVTELDDECAACHYQWGSFRPTSVTALRAVPVSRRRHDRLPVELSLVYVSSELEIEAMTRDLSESGVFVCSQVLDPIGTVCQLTILLDGGPPLRIAGIVRRVVDHSDQEAIGLGVEFIGVGANELAWIKTAITRIIDQAHDTQAGF